VGRAGFGRTVRPAGVSDGTDRDVRLVGRDVAARARRVVGAGGGAAPVGHRYAQQGTERGREGCGVRCGQVARRVLVAAASIPSGARSVGPVTAVVATVVGRIGRGQDQVGERY